MNIILSTKGSHMQTLTTVMQTKPKPWFMQQKTNCAYSPAPRTCMRPLLKLALKKIHNVINIHSLCSYSYIMHSQSFFLPVSVLCPNYLWPCGSKNCQDELHRLSAMLIPSDAELLLLAAIIMLSRLHCFETKPNARHLACCKTTIKLQYPNKISNVV